MVTHEMNIPTGFIDSLSDFVKELRNFEPAIVDAGKSQTEKRPFLIWYRGVPNFNYTLLPRLYRTVQQHLKDCNKGTSEFWPQLDKDESNYLKCFRNRNYHLLERLPENPLTWMNVMQHYDVPTRLLDWSENAIVSIFFALLDQFSQKHDHDGQAPCIWCLKPLELNRYTYLRYHLFHDIKSLPDMFSLSFHSTQESSSSVYRTSLYDYFFSDRIHYSLSDYHCYPLAINAPYNNERIRAQSGVFTLFPMNIPKPFQQVEELSMEKLPDAGKFLYQLILRKPVEIGYELKAMGVKRSQFFPEMPSISYDIEQELYKTF